MSPMTQPDNSNGTVNVSLPGMDLGYERNLIAYKLKDLIRTAESLKASRLCLSSNAAPIFILDGDPHELPGCRIGERCMDSLSKETLQGDLLKALRRGRDVCVDFSLDSAPTEPKWKVHAKRRGSDTHLLFIQESR